VARELPYLRSLPVTVLAGVGDKTADALAQVEVETVFDLLTYYPRRYIDRTEQRAIRDLTVGDEAVVLGTVRKASTRRTRNGKSLTEVYVADETGALKCTFFNQPWRTRTLHEGVEAVVFGKVELFSGRRQMTNPVVDLVGDQTLRIVPVYPQSEKARVFTREVMGWVAEALDRAKEFADPLPEEWRRRLQVVDRTSAFHQIHMPETMGATHTARKRLAFDELLRLQMTLVLRKRAVERDAQGLRHRVGGPLVERFRKALPFPLTAAQSRAMAEIDTDLGGPQPMHRLLQGDVGSGKTLVAVHALLAAVDGGHQGAFMAPTEVLAEQHFLSVRGLVGDLTVPDDATLMGERAVRVELLTNRTSAGDRVKLHAGLATGEVDILIGTHALLTEAVGFRSLGAVVIDEQHRFGVEQRAALRAKGAGEIVPDVLVMTATPIPRTAAMTVYGDLDVTTLDELPPGRTPIETMWPRGPLDEAEAWARINAEVSAGHQAFVVCPLVEESERIQARSATEQYEELRTDQLKDLRVGLLHGQMAGREKESVMADFRSGTLDALVATTVIEVGVDVPNATVMVILDADRFGLAQLHQLRGRVGRGQAASWCYLISGADSPDALARLKAFVETSDGFELAEKDLDIRGEGTVLGTRQKGRSDLKLASLARDRDLVERAREVAFDLVDHDPTLQGHRVLAAEVRDLVDDDEAEFLFMS
jgi:ATP-dependent DNA helicase RecG